MDAISEFVDSSSEAMALAVISAQALLADEDGERMADFASVVGAGIAHGIAPLDYLGRSVVGIVGAVDRVKAEALVSLIVMRAELHACGEEG